MHRLEIGSDVYLKFTSLKEKHKPSASDEEFLQYLLSHFEKFLSKFYSNSGHINGIISNGGKDHKLTEAVVSLNKINNLNLPELTLHNKSETKYWCPECTTSFSNLLEIKSHFEKEHELEDVSLSCTCGQCFTKMSHFLCHYIMCPIAATDLQQSSGNISGGNGGDSGGGSINKSNTVTTAAMASTPSTDSATAENDKLLILSSDDKFCTLSSSPSTVKKTQSHNKTSMCLTNGSINDEEMDNSELSASFQNPIDPVTNSPNIYGDENNSYPVFSALSDEESNELSTEQQISFHFSNPLNLIKTNSRDAIETLCDKRVSDSHVSLGRISSQDALSPSGNRTHGNSKLFDCEHCEKSFKSKGLLDQHKHLHYPPRHECEFCGRRFRWPPQFYTHKQQCSRRKQALAVATELMMATEATGHHQRHGGLGKSASTNVATIPANYHNSEQHQQQLAALAAAVAASVNSTNAGNISVCASNGPGVSTNSNTQCFCGFQSTVPSEIFEHKRTCLAPAARAMILHKLMDPENISQSSNVLGSSSLSSISNNLIPSLMDSSEISVNKHQLHQTSLNGMSVKDYIPGLLSSSTSSLLSRNTASNNQTTSQPQSHLGNGNNHNHHNSQPHNHHQPQQPQQQQQQQQHHRHHNHHRHSIAHIYHNMNHNHNSSRNLNNHRNHHSNSNHHNHHSNNSENKPFECDFCDSRFMTKISLKQHLDGKHSDQAKYCCEKCGKGYFWNASFNYHKKKCMVPKSSFLNC